MLLILRWYNVAVRSWMYVYNVANYRCTMWRLVALSKLGEYKGKRIAGRRVGKEGRGYS